MARLRTGKRRGGRGQNGGGGGGQQSAFAASVNLPGINYFSGCFYFIDRVRQTSELWSNIPRNDARLDANHYPANLPAGQSATLLVVLGINNIRSATRFKAGPHKITWTPTGTAGASVTVSGGGITSVVPGSAGVATFTASSTLDTMFITVTAPAGGAGGVTNLQCFHTDHEAALLSGEVFDPDFLAQLTSFPYLKEVRFLDWLVGNFGTQTNAADWPAMSYQSWCMPERGVPPEIVGLLAKKLRTLFGRDVTMWTVMPRFATNACMTALFSRMHAVDPTGTWKLKAGGANEPWGFGFPAFTYFADTYYSANSLSVVDGDGNPSTNSGDRMACSFMHHAMRTSAAAEAVFGVPRVIRIATQQTDFVTFMKAAYRFRDTTNALYGGITGKDWVNAGGETEFTCYWYDYDGGANSYKERLRQDIGSFTHAQLRDIYIADINNKRDTFLIPHRAQLTALGVTAPWTMYEGACHSFYNRNDTGAGAPGSFACTVNTGNNTLEFPVETTAWIADGDQLITPNQTSLNPALGFPSFFYVRKTGTNAVRCYRTLGDYTADSGNTGAGAATLVAGNYTACPQTRFARWSDKINSFNRSPEGLEVWQHAVNNYCLHPSLQINNFNLFVHMLASKDGTDSFVNPFGAHNNGQYEPDTAIVDYLQGLGGAPAPLRYVRAGAAGAGTGLNWTDAYTALPATLTRGTTYYVADGTYPSYVFNDAESGTSVITVRKATASDHGTSTGWVSTYGDGEALFSSSDRVWEFTAGYYNIDGSVGSGKSPGGYGFRLFTTATRSSPSWFYFVYLEGQNNTIRRVEFDWDNGTAASSTSAPRMLGAFANNLTIENCYFHHGPTYAFDFGGFPGTVVYTNCTVKNNYFYRFGGGGGETAHWELFWWMNFDNSEIAFNTFENIYGDVAGQTGWIMIGRTNNLAVHGNVFFSSDPAFCSIGGNGVIATWSSDEYVNDNIKIIGNTFANLDGGFGPKIYWSHNTASDTNIVCKNNIYFGNNGFQWTGVTSQSHEAVGPTGQSGAGSNLQSNLTSAIFVNYAGHDFRLATATAAGDSTVGAPYNVDTLGSTRGADGTWDRGAYEKAA